MRIGQTLPEVSRGLGRDRNIDQNERGILPSDIGGIGAVCVGYSEIDKYAVKVYERQFNGTDVSIRHGATEDTKAKTSKQGVESASEGLQHERTQPNNIGRRNTREIPHNGHTNYGDITKINEKELPDFDTVVGGFPCQAFSVAGKRGGFDDTRGTLFFDIARICAEKKPKHLVLENVKGLLSHDKGRTIQTILGVLSDLGYRVEWQVLNSKDFGVPQNRERIIIIGHLRGECGRQVFPILGVSAENLRKIVATGHQATDIYDSAGSATTQSALGGGQGAKTGLYAVDMTRREDKNYRVRKDGRAGTLDANYFKGLANQERPGVLDEARIRRLTPKECERLQGFPDDWTRIGRELKEFTPKYGEVSRRFEDVEISDTQRYKMCGNAVTTNVIEAVFTAMIERGCYD